MRTQNNGADSSTRSFLLIDDHPMMRDAIRHTIDEVSPGARTVSAATLAETRERLTGGMQYDYILLDLNLPDARGVETLTQLRQASPGTPIVIISGDTERDTIVRCLELGAVGYIPKTLHSDAFSYALRLIVSGQVYVPHQVVASRKPFSSDHQRRPKPSDGDPRRLGLTERQVSVLALMLRGMPNKLICREMNLAEGTVKVHVSAVLRALGVRTRTQAVIAASEMGLKFDEPR